MMQEEKFFGSNDASYLVSGDKAAPSVASSGASNSDRDLIFRSLFAANHNPWRRRECFFHPSPLGGTSRSHAIRIDPKKIVHLGLHRR
jgi:hypothetical protein